MKTRITIFVLLLFAIFIIDKQATAEEKTKEYYEAWAASGVNTLEISNKYGQVKVLNNRSDSVTISVIITVEAANENKADELLGDINVSFKKSGSTVSAVTSLDNNFKSQRKFSIDYEINIPSDKNLSISNKYGDTFVNKLNANGNFDIKYGSFSANELVAPENGTMKLDLAYGNGSIDEAGDFEAIIAYSPLSMDEVANLKMESKYSQISIDKAGEVVIDSKYDKFSFDNVKSLNLTSKYSHVSVDKLSGSIKVEAGYGSIKVDEVAADFGTIDITNSYGQIELGLDDASYSVDASCSYCGISYPQDNFKGNRVKENNTSEINGTVGEGGGKVTIKSRYGDIKLK